MWLPSLALASLAGAAGSQQQRQLQLESEYACSSVLSVVVGEGPSFEANRAQRVYIEERDPTGQLLHRLQLSDGSQSFGSAPACTLGVSSPGGNNFWEYDGDGMITISANQQLVSLLCFDTPVGGQMSMSGGKVVALVYPNRSVALSAPMTATYLDIFSDTGMRQVVTVDGDSGFWLAGSSNEDWCVKLGFAV